jgi:retron-type reverse transcriptase
MGKRHNNLFGRIATFEALRKAALRALRSKRQKPGAAAFAAGLERELVRLQRELVVGRYRPGRYVTLQLRDPKPRMVSAAPFRDRVMHHALMDVVGPIFEQGFIANSFANRIGKGTHRGIEMYERYRDRHAFVLRCDIFRFFPAVDHTILKRDFRRRIACAETLRLLDLIVDGSNPQEAVNLHFSGDDLFAPYDRRRGLPIGNLTSQWFGNIYLDRLDHFVTERLGAPYVRYVDDFALFADNADQLDDWRNKIAAFLEGRRLRLHPRKTVILACDQPADFLGYTLLPDGKRRLPEASVRRHRNRLRGMADGIAAGALSPSDAAPRIASWQAHASFAHAARLQRAIRQSFVSSLARKIEGRGAR